MSSPANSSSGYRFSLLRGAYLAPPAPHSRPITVSPSHVGSRAGPAGSSSRTSPTPDAATHRFSLRRGAYIEPSPRSPSSSSSAAPPYSAATADGQTGTSRSARSRSSRPPVADRSSSHQFSITRGAYIQRPSRRGRVEEREVVDAPPPTYDSIFPTRDLPAYDEADSRSTSDASVNRREEVDGEGEGEGETGR